MIVRMLLTLCALAAAPMSAWAQETKPAAHTSNADVEAAKTNQQPKLSIIDSGQEPRRPLRYQPAKGQRFATTVLVESSGNRETIGQSIEKQPRSVISMEVQGEILDVMDNGEIVEKFELTEYDLQYPDGSEPSQAKDMRAAFAKVNGLVMEIVIDSRGQFVRGGLDPSATPLPPEAQAAVKQLNQQLSTMAIPFPEEAVGLGARWGVEREMTQPTMLNKVKVEYTLASIEGSRATLRLAMDQNGAPRSSKNTVRELSGHSEGQFNLDQRDISILSGRIVTDSVILQEIATTSPPTRRRNTDSMVMTITSRPLDAASTRPTSATTP